MPAVDVNGPTPQVRPFYVLVTGFGPFSRYTVNPSWLAVKPLHNAVLRVDASIESSLPVDRAGFVETVPPSIVTGEIHVTALQVPVTYEDVLAVVPGLHARPPVLPLTADADYTSTPPPPDGFDVILHVGVAGRGPLRMERLGHKFGYNMKDANGCLAPIVRVTREETSRAPSEPSEAEIMERARLGEDYTIESPTDGTEPPKRGFGKGYESFPEEIYTDVDVEKLVHYLKRCSVEQIYSSLDAGHYLCDFIYYCSLAEGKRAKSDKSTPKVLFLHCPPVNQPLSTEEVTDAIKKSIIWLCSSSAP